MVDLVDRQRAIPVALLIVVLVLTPVTANVVHRQLVLVHAQAALHDQVRLRHHEAVSLADVQPAEEVPLVTVAVIHAVAGAAEL